MLKYLLFTVLVFSFSSDPLFAEEDSSVLQGENKYSFKTPTEIDEEVPKDLVKNKLDYPANIIVTFVDRCASNMMAYMPMHPMQSRPMALTMCSCLIDQFRSDFELPQFKKGGTKLAEMMAPQYSEVCKQLQFGKKYPL